MYTALLILSVLLVSLAAGFFRLRRLAWTALLGATVAAFIVLTPTSLVWKLTVAALFLAIALPLNVDALRRRLFTAPVMGLYRRMVPKLSDTELTALEAGTVGWEGELFAGKPNFKDLLRQPEPDLTAAERAFVDGPVEEACRMIDDWEITHELADMPPAVWDFLKREKFFGMIIPERFGGLGFSARAHSLVLQKLSSRSITVASTVAVPNSLGPAELLLKYGTEEQKDYYLPRLAIGEEIPCFALTGPDAGSDATSIPDYGVVCKGQFEGQETLGIRLHFDKRYITLAPVATVVGLAFQLKDPDGLLGDRQDIGISLALLPRSTPGVEIGTRHFPLNVPFQNGPIRGDGVFVPLDYLIGGPEMAGKGWRMLVECLAVGRAVSLPSSAAGSAKLAAWSTGAYARIRRQFGLPIGRFEGVEEALARMAANAYTISALTRMTTAAVDSGEKPAVTSAIAKYHSTEMAREVARDAMDIHGGKGIMLGRRNYLGRGWQSAPISITVEGANIMTRSLMIFGQGAIRCHPEVLNELAALQQEDPEQALIDFDRALFSHIGYALSNACRSFLLGLTGGRLAGAPREGKVKRYYRKAARYSAALGLTADVAMLTLGGKLKFKERLSARLGDVLSQLYILSAILKRYHDQGRPAADYPLVAWAAQNCLNKAETALFEFVRNYPIRPVAWLLYPLLFPVGRWDGEPKDRLGHRVAVLLMAPSETRERMASGIYTANDGQHVPGFMDHILADVIKAEPIERRIVKALRAGEVDAFDPETELTQAVAAGAITESEAEFLREVRANVAEIIAVDDFDPHLLAAGAREEDVRELEQAEAA